ncbi:MAG: FAD-binding protein [Anaerolineales bacterium]|nr:FAD-binding protein [Anaerolineales bacterium]
MPISTSVITQLRRIVGQENVLSEDADLFLYAYDASFPEHRPDAVVFPRTTEAVSQVMALACEERTPVVPRGAGTGLSGGSVPMQGGITLCFSKMNRLTAVDPDNLTATVEPGLINAHLQAALARYSLFYPPDPASMKVCTLGGNIAEDAGGPKCFKYGVTKNYTLGLEVVLPNSEVIHTGGTVVKNTTGYDLTRLFIGSEGTLGVFTQMVLRLMPLPEARRTMLALFDSLETAGNTVGAIVSAGIIPSALEMMDNLLIRCAEDFVHVGLPRDAAALLLIEVDGPDAALDAQVERIREISAREGARELRVATTAAETDALWLARRTVIGAAGRLRPSLILQDVTVPRSALPTMTARIGEISRQYDLPIGVLAHAGDGNLHPIILFDGRQPEQLQREHNIEREIITAALELGGTLTGEHGVGASKRDYLGMQLNAQEIAIHRGLKALFDPQNILNPAKIVG